MDYIVENPTAGKYSFNLGTDHSIMYLNHALSYKEVRDISIRDFYLLKVSSVSFDDQAPKKEALENVLSSVRMQGINFIFLIVGHEESVDFYYGISKDLSAKHTLPLEIDDLGNYILKPAITANFRGSTVDHVNNVEKQNILNNLKDMQYYGMIEGVPGANKDDEKYQGIDRLINVMYGDSYCFMVVAKPLDDDAVNQIQNHLYRFYDEINPQGKVSLQASGSTNSGVSGGVTEGVTRTAGVSDSKSETRGNNSGYSYTEGSGSNKSVTRGTSRGNSSSSGGSSSSSGSNTGTSKSGTEGTNTSKSETYSGGENYSESDTKGSNVSKSRSDSTTVTTNVGTSGSASMTFEYVNRRVQDFIKFMDDVVFPRLDYGKGKGMFLTSMFVSTRERTALQKIENTVTAIYSGEAGNKVPLKAMSLTGNAKDAFNSFQLPHGKLEKSINDYELLEHYAMHHLVDPNAEAKLGNWITTNELGMVAGLPQKEVVGMSLNEEVEFGLNFSSVPAKEDRIDLGYLIQNGNELENTHVYLDKKELDKHIFVAGVTGSGKTTTCQKILKESGLPFLVIEPAKTEYRVMQKEHPDMLIFTLGDNMTNPLKMNPFMFYEGESITSRVDMLCASIESAFDMEAAIPQIIERAIYKCYEDYGWNISVNTNYRYADPFDGSGLAFPTMEDLVRNCKIVVENQGFDDRLKNDYIGSINARLLGLVSGSKGFLLNTHASIDFTDLLDHQVVFELENIRNGAEKSLIMGFILINLSEAIRQKYRKEGKFSHITLVEEAHRLLSKYTPGDNPNKKHGVEMFADMLAEIRKYGECLVIADQIPDKLTPDVLKNTNTKIIHRIFAEDDKEAVGNTVMLKREQKDFLSNLQTGRAVYFTQATEKAVQVQIKRSFDTSAWTPKDAEIRDQVIEYFCDNYQRGLFPGLELMSKRPSREQYDCFYQLYKTVFAERYIQAGLEKYRSGNAELTGLFEMAEACIGFTQLMDYLWVYGMKKSPDVLVHIVWDENIRERVIEYICDRYQEGLYPGLEIMPERPNREHFDCLSQLYETGFAKEYVEVLKAQKLNDNPSLVAQYEKAVKCIGFEQVYSYIWEYGLVKGHYLIVKAPDGKEKFSEMLRSGVVTNNDKRNYLQCRK